jgi:chromosome segregation ATPase
MNAAFTPRPALGRACTALLLGAVLCLPAICQAQAEKTAERQARRAQLQMQNLQQQLSEAQAAQARADADKAAADKLAAGQAGELARLRAENKAGADKLRGAATERAELLARVAALERQLAEQKTAADEAAAGRQREQTAALATRDAAGQRLQARFDAQAALLADCSAKNERLFKLGAELIDRYRNKTATDAWKQREPLLGLADVEMFNTVQAWRDRAEAERFEAPALRPATP